jgi:MoaA/NifB/PqqE/SkfB family radical SAM enzyme
MKKTGAYFNIFKLRVNMALKRKRLHNYPVQAYIEPTLFCNLRCPACPTGLQLGLRPSATIKWDLFKSAIDEIGDYVFSLYMYNWGEPLLHRQTPEMVKYAKSKDMSIIMSTNLSLKLSDDYIDRLVQSGLDRLIVSLDGTTSDVYDKYRLRGEFQLVRDNMLRIQAAKKRYGVQTPRVVWQFLVFKHNEHQIGQALSEFEEWGADEIVIEAAIMPAAPHDEGYEPSTIPKYNLYDPAHHSRLVTEKHDKSGRPCSWLYGIFVLNPNGKVSPCCASAGEATDFGDYSAQDGFFDVWNNSTFQRARALFSKSSPPQPKKPDSVEAPLNLVQIKTRTSEEEEQAKLLAGMASNITGFLKQDQLICSKCPIPWRQDDVDNVITDEVLQLMKSYTGKSVKERARTVLAYFLMGAPNWRAIAKAELVRLHAPLSLSFGRR